jgi:hypothetical protein
LDVRDDGSGRSGVSVALQWVPVVVRWGKRV